MTRHPDWRIDSRERRHKQTIYLPGELGAEMKAEAARLDRSLSWLLQLAWTKAKPVIQGYATRPDGETRRGPKARGPR